MALLEGIKVVDFSKWLPGQYCGMLLGDTVQMLLRLRICRVMRHVAFGLKKLKV